VMKVWRLDDPKLDELLTTWRVCCRSLFNQSQRTKSPSNGYSFNLRCIYRLLNNRNDLISNWRKTPFCELFSISEITQEESG